MVSSSPQLTVSYPWSILQLSYNLQFGFVNEIAPIWMGSPFKMSQKLTLFWIVNNCALFIFSLDTKRNLPAFLLYKYLISQMRVLQILKSLLNSSINSCFKMELYFYKEPVLL